MEMRIGIAIPCYKYHIPALKLCLDSIEAQTRKPDEVVVGCSSVEAEDIPVYSYSFPLRILTRPGRHNAAENRNYAVSALTTDIVSFFDADDVMHPQRIEAIQTSFVAYPHCSIVLHNYLMDTETKNPFEHYTTFDMRPNMLFRGPTGCAVYKSNSPQRIHHSQVSVTRDVLSCVKFNEAKDHERKEDAIFCGDVLARPDCKNVYIANPLSKYYMEGQTH
jgi:glycosyltransferase involved in cell wall biosynthesis